MLTIGVQNPKPKYNFIRLFYSSQETLPPKCIGPLRGEEAEASLSDVRGGVQRQVGWWQDEEFYHLQARWRFAMTVKSFTHEMVYTLWTSF